MVGRAAVVELVRKCGISGQHQLPAVVQVRCMAQSQRGTDIRHAFAGRLVEYAAGRRRIDARIHGIQRADRRSEPQIVRHRVHKIELDAVDVELTGVGREGRILEKPVLGANVPVSEPAVEDGRVEPQAPVEPFRTQPQLVTCHVLGVIGDQAESGLYFIAGARNAVAALQHCGRTGIVIDEVGKPARLVGGAP